RRHRVPAAGALAFATAERVVDRVHGDAAHVRALAPPAVATGLADRHQTGLAVADGADRGAAIDRHAAHLGGRQTQGGEHAYLGDELDRGARAPAHLPARARLELDVVHRGTDGDVPQRQRVAGADLGALAALQHVADLHVVRSEDVALLAVAV